MSETQELFKEGKIVVARVADKFIATKNHYVITTKIDRKIYYSDGKYWNNGGENEIKTYVKNLLGEGFSKHMASEVTAHVEAMTFIDDFPAPKLNYIPLQNGVYDLETDMLKEYTPELCFTKRDMLPLIYNKESKCENFDKFLREIVASDDVELIYEFIGYCLYRSYHISKILMLIGSGANGKSTLVKVIKTFLGNENVSGRTMQELDGNKFAPATLKGKLANIMADLPSKQLKTTSLFKTLTGGDFVTVEAKYGKDPVNFVNTAKLIFCANQLPITDDKSDAFFRRFIFIDFPNKFEGKNADINLCEKLTTETELSGIFNRAVQALKGVLKRGTFSFSKNTEDIRQWYKRSSDPVDYYISDTLMFEFENFISTEDLYIRYLSFCGKNSLIYDSEPVFIKKMISLIGDNIKPHYPTIDGNRKKGYKGIKWKPHIQQMIDNEPLQQDCKPC